MQLLNMGPGLIDEKQCQMCKEIRIVNSENQLMMIKYYFEKLLFQENGETVFE